MEELSLFNDYTPSFLPFGADSISDSSSSPSMMGEIFNPPFPEGDEFPEDTATVFIPDQSSDSASVLTGELGSPISRNSGSFGTASPVTSSPGDEGMFIKSEPVSQEQYMFNNSPSVAPVEIVPANEVQVPERKKRRRVPEPKTRAVGKKRKGHSEESVVMDIDERALASKTSDELDSMIKTISEKGTQRAEEELKRLRKIKRMVKNRESAQMSRIRHRDHVGLIEAELEYQKMVSSRLREYANKLKLAMLQHDIEPPPEPEIPEFVPPPPTELSVVDVSRGVMRPLRTAGFCLMMFVLSLGVVYNIMRHVEPDSKNSLVAVSTTEHSGAVIVEPSTTPLTQIPPVTKTESDSVDVIRKSTYLSYDTAKEDSSLALVIPKQQQPPQQEQQHASLASALVPRSAVAVMPYTTKTIFGSSKPRLADRTWTLDNTSYILVNDAKEFVPHNLDYDHLQTRTEPVIGLLIPASSFNIPNLAPDDVVELVCGIRNATLVPHSVLAGSLY